MFQSPIMKTLGWFYLENRTLFHTTDDFGNLVVVPLDCWIFVVESADYSEN